MVDVVVVIVIFTGSSLPPAGIHTKQGRAAVHSDVCQKILALQGLGYCTTMLEKTRSCADVGKNKVGCCTFW